MSRLQQAKHLLVMVQTFAVRDDEAAHSTEDELREYALRAVLDGDPDALEIVKIALSTAGIRFSRWCA